MVQMKNTPQIDYLDMKLKVAAYRVFYNGIFEDFLGFACILQKGRKKIYSRGCSNSLYSLNLFVIDTLWMCSQMKNARLFIDDWPIDILHLSETSPIWLGHVSKYTQTIYKLQSPRDLTKLFESEK